MFVYKLTFSNGDFYIGQTQNFVQRIRHHKYTKGKGSPLLTYAFDNYELVSAEILKEGLTQEEANQQEQELIKELKPALNTLAGGVVMRGLNHPRCKHSEEQILEVVDLFINTDATYKDIGNITEMNYSLIHDITKGRTHTWATEGIDLEYHIKRRAPEYVVYDKHNTEFRAKTIKELSALTGESGVSLARITKTGDTNSAGFSGTIYEYSTYKSPTGDRVSFTPPEAKEYFQSLNLSKFQINQLILKHRASAGWSVITTPI